MISGKSPAALGLQSGMFRGHQTLTRRARVCSASSTGLTPKSRLNSRLNCDGLSYSIALAAVLELYPSWAMSRLARSARIRLRYWKCKAQLREARRPGSLGHRPRPHGGCLRLRPPEDHERDDLAPPCGRRTRRQSATIPQRGSGRRHIGGRLDTPERGADASGGSAHVPHDHARQDGQGVTKLGMGTSWAVGRASSSACSPGHPLHRHVGAYENGKSEKAIGEVLDRTEAEGRLPRHQERRLPPGQGPGRREGRSRTSSRPASSG